MNQGGQVSQQHTKVKGLSFLCHPAPGHSSSDSGLFSSAMVSVRSNRRRTSLMWALVTCNLLLLIKCYRGGVVEWDTGMALQLFKSQDDESFWDCVPLLGYLLPGWDDKVDIACSKFQQANWRLAVVSAFLHMCFICIIHLFLCRLDWRTGEIGLGIHLRMFCVDADVAMTARLLFKDCNTESPIIELVRGITTRSIRASAVMPVVYGGGK